VSWWLGLAKNTACTGIESLSAETSPIVLHFDFRRYGLLTLLIFVTAAVGTIVICVSFIERILCTQSVTGSIPTVICVCTEVGTIVSLPLLQELRRQAFLSTSDNLYKHK
jgi:hypothetical protein